MQQQRVTQAKGTAVDLAGYRWGVARKRASLDREAAASDAGPRRPQPTQGRRAPRER